MSHNDWKDAFIDDMAAAQERGEYAGPDGDDGMLEEYNAWMAERPEPVDISGFPFRDIPTARCINREGLDVYTAWGHAFGRGLVTTKEFVKFLKG